MDDTTTTTAGPCTAALAAHGAQRECMALAAAMRMDRSAISFTFCRTMLQRHWAMRCQHGGWAESVDLIPSDQRWRQHDEITPVLAILLENA